MTQIKIELDEGRNKLVNMCKLVNSLDSKENAISKIILDWGILQSLSNNEIYDKILEYFKERWGRKKTHDKRDLIKEAERRLKEAYKEYSDSLKNFDSVMVKKYKVTKKFVGEFMQEENWTDDEDSMENTSKSHKKIKVKIFNDFQDFISEKQEEIGGKYRCEIEHDESWWFTKENFGPLTIEYSGGKESSFYLDMYIREVIKEMIRILRGDKSLIDFMDENKSYLERVKKEANF